MPCGLLWPNSASLQTRVNRLLATVPGVGVVVPALLLDGNRSANSIGASVRGTHRRAGHVTALDHFAKAELKILRRWGPKPGKDGAPVHAIGQGADGRLVKIAPRRN
jgi:hypothetical protein